MFRSLALPFHARAPTVLSTRRRAMSSVVKKRRKKMRKHKHRKMLKKTRWQRKHKG
jgi:Mitochondrial mRNA-processing protein COX24, C-terminal